MSQLTDFYLRSGTDAEGRTFDWMLAQSDDELEKSHTFIQWLFPLNEISLHNKNAPVITDEDLPELQAFDGNVQYVRALNRFFDFYGLQQQSNTDSDVLYLVPSGTFASKNWLTPRNHNLKRITRMIRCAMVFDMPWMGKLLRDSFCNLKNTPQGSWLDETTLNYWHDAVTLPLDQKLNVSALSRKIFRT